MMKILHVVDWYRRIGGAEKLLFDTLRCLEEISVKNIVIANENPANKKTNERKEYFIKYLDHDTLPFLMNFRKTKKELKNIVLRENPDVIHIHNFQNPFLTAELIRLKPTVRSIHDARLYCFALARLLPETNDICPYPMGYSCIKNKCISSQNFRFSHFFNYMLLKRSQKLDSVIAESDAMADCFLQNGFIERQIHKLPNFTSQIPDFEIAERRSRHYNKEENTLLFVGRASYEKGIDILLEAASLITDIPFNLYILTGYGPYLCHIKRKIKGLSLENKVIMPGPQNYDITRDYYIKSDVVIVPSVWLEPFCLVGIEAMMNGKPVIGSNVGGIPDWLVDGETGFLFPYGNAKILAEKIRILLTDKKLAEKLGQNGRRRAQSLYTKEQYIPMLIQIYETTIRKHGSKKGFFGKARGASWRD